MMVERVAEALRGALSAEAILAMTPGWAKHRPHDPHERLARTLVAVGLITRQGAIEVCWAVANHKRPNPDNYIAAEGRGAALCADAIRSLTTE